MASTRRMGSVDSAKAEAMLDAAEEILREEGYGALTSRRVAEHLGVKQRLVYYYFRSMNDLILETFKRLSVRDLERQKAAYSSDSPLHEVWNICLNVSDARLISEFIALANRDEGLRREVASFIEESRRMQINALKNALPDSNGGEDFLRPEVIAFIGTSLALALNREAAIGVKKGHAAVDKMIKQFFDKLEP